MLKYFSAPLRLILLAALSTLGFVRCAVGGISGDELGRRMEEHEQWQTRTLCAYTVDREYVLTNKHLGKDARMKVRLNYQKGRQKYFRVLSMDAPGITRRSLLDLLKEEAESDGIENEKGTLSPRNYNFTVLGTEACGDDQCFKVRMSPKKRSEYLVDGTAWVNARDFEFVRIAGEVSKSPSIWLSRPVFEQQFRAVSGFWLASYNSSRTKVLFLGEADLAIHYSNYSVEACPGGQDK